MLEPMGQKWGGGITFQLFPQLHTNFASEKENSIFSIIRLSQWQLLSKLDYSLCMITKIHCSVDWPITFTYKQLQKRDAMIETLTGLLLPSCCLALIIFTAALLRDSIAGPALVSLRIIPWANPSRLGKVTGKKCDENKTITLYYLHRPKNPSKSC